MRLLVSFLLTLILLASTAQMKALAAYSIWNSELISQPESVEGLNIQRAVAFLRKMGFDDVADNIMKMFKDGKLYWDPTLDANGDTGMTGDITIAASIIHHTKAAGPKKYNHPFNEDSDFENIVELARTLYHEKVHVHQSCLFKAGSNMRSDDTPHEIEAWSKTIIAMDQWYKTLYNQYKEVPASDDTTKPNIKKANDATKLKLLKKAKIVLNNKVAYTASFVEANCYGDKHKDVWNDLKETGEKMIQQLDKLISQLSPPPAEPAEGHERGISYTEPVPEQSQTMDQLLGHDLELEKSIKQFTPKLPRDTEAKVVFIGQGKAAGHIFDLKVTNKADTPINQPIPSGLILWPSTDSYQPMIIGSDNTIDVPPQSESTVALDGFCMDHKKLPPPDGGLVCQCDCYDQIFSERISAIAHQLVMDAETGEPAEDHESLPDGSTNLKLLDPATGNVLQETAHNVFNGTNVQTKYTYAHGPDDISRKKETVTHIISDGSKLPPFDATVHTTYDTITGQANSMSENVKFQNQVCQAQLNPQTGQVQDIQINPSKIPLHADVRTPAEPPSTTPEKLSWTPEFLTSDPIAPVVAALVASGNDLFAQGQLQRAKGDARRYHSTIVQRALWYVINGVDKAALKSEMDSQLSQRKDQPSKKTEDKAIDEIWGDVDLVIKHAPTSTAGAKR